MWLKSNLLSRCAVGGVDVHKLGFEVVAAVFLVGAGQDGIGISVDCLAGFDNLDTTAVTFGTSFWFRDVCARLDIRIEGRDKL